jgi:hypothetical protein
MFGRLFKRTPKPQRRFWCPTCKVILLEKTHEVFTFWLKFSEQAFGHNAWIKDAEVSLGGGSFGHQVTHVVILEIPATATPVADGKLSIVTEAGAVSLADDLL